MPALRFLRTYLQTTCPTIHATRLRARMSAVEVFLYHPRLTLTELGRALRSPALVKHNIKRIGRLLGNGHLYAERSTLYVVVTEWLLARVIPIQSVWTQSFSLGQCFSRSCLSYTLFYTPCEVKVCTKKTRCKTGRVLVR